MTEHERGTLRQSSEFIFLRIIGFTYINLHIIKGSVLEIIYKKCI